MKLVTHNEEFHTDDVFCTALLLTLYPDAVVTRTRDAAVIAAGDIVYDVGRIFDPAKGRFDHHQLGSDKRPNGVIYSAFGLVWREYGLRYCNNDRAIWEIMDKHLVTPIDASDNGQTIGYATDFGVRPFTIDRIVTNLNPLAGSVESYEDQFSKAVTLAGEVLDRYKATVTAHVQALKSFREHYQAAEDRSILVATFGTPVNTYVDDFPELIYVVSQRPNDTTWGILAVSTEPDGFVLRKPFPQAWRGKEPVDLEHITGIQGVSFCHANGFYAVTHSQETALALAHASLVAQS